MTKKVLVAMSGGVDSSAAAVLLQRQGWQVEGATFRLQDESLPGCGAGGCGRDIEDAAQVCRQLGIRHHLLDWRMLFRQAVVDYFVGEYRRGATPNPCVACNRWVKYGAFVDTALAMGFDHVATGHYAAVEYDAARGRFRLRRGDFIPKDQSYVLYTLTQRQLSHIVLPLAPYRKEEIRAIAEEAGLQISGKADSQDICFIPNGDYGAFLQAYATDGPAAGDFVDTAGQVLGRHRGYWYYTVGQRKGLGISLGRPAYVLAIDPQANRVVLGDNEALFRHELTAEDACWIDEAPRQPLACTAKIRYTAQPAKALLHPPQNGRVRVEFTQPQRAVTAGQAVVFYHGEYVLGGATIIG